MGQVTKQFERLAAEYHCSSQPCIFSILFFSFFFLINHRPVLESLVISNCTNVTDIVGNGPGNFFQSNFQTNLDWKALLAVDLTEILDSNLTTVINDGAGLKTHFHNNILITRNVYIARKTSQNLTNFFRFWIALRQRWQECHIQCHK